MNKVTISYPLTANGASVSLEQFNGGAAIMEALANLVRDNGIPAGAEIRVTIEPVRTRGRYAKWKTMTTAASK